MYLIIGLIIGVTGGVLYHTFITSNNRKETDSKVNAILEYAQKERKRILDEAKEKSNLDMGELEKEYKAVMEAFNKRKTVFKTRESNLQRKESLINNIKQVISDENDEINEIQKVIQSKNKKQLEKLLEISGSKYDDIKEQIISSLDSNLREDYANRIKGKYDNLLDIAEQKAQNIVKQCVQRYSKKNAVRVSFPPITVNEAFMKRFELELEELKKLTEVEIEFDSEEQTLYVSYYNLIKRTAAYEVVKALVKTKKGVKVSIPDMVKHAMDKIGKSMVVAGEMIVKELRIKDLPKEIVKLVGRMNFRTSFGQNIMMHSLEVAFFGELLAYEVGADPDITKKAALLHDLGKAVDQEIEGSHDLLTKQILEKYNVDPRIVHAAYNHHDAEEMGSVEARLVQSADIISASRPGSRMEAGEQYLERIKAIEEAALSMGGVQKAYAIQAGREIRAYVDSDNVSDEDMKGIAKELAKNIEDNIQYPGQVMVNMIRELRVTENAK